MINRIDSKVKKQDVNVSISLLETIDKQYNKFKQDEFIDFENLSELIENLEHYNEIMNPCDDLKLIPLEEDETYKKYQQELTLEFKAEVMQEIIQGTE